MNQDFAKKQSVYIVFLTSETICIVSWALLKTNLLDIGDVYISDTIHYMSVNLKCLDKRNF